MEEGHSCLTSGERSTRVETRADRQADVKDEEKKLLDSTNIGSSRHDTSCEEGDVSTECKTLQSNEEDTRRSNSHETAVDAAVPATEVSGADHVVNDAVDDAGTDEQYPVDKGWAWMIVVGCFGMHILAVGGVKSFGVLFVEFQNKYKTSSKALAGVQAVSASLMLGLGPVSNALATKYSCRTVVLCGGILTCAGFVCSAFIPSFEWLFVTYGLMCGIGFSLSYAPCVVMVGHHFKKRRSLANGISTSGSGVGSFALPNLMRFLLDYYGLFGSLIIIGGLMLNICVCACLFRPLSSYKKTSKNLKQHSREDKVVKNTAHIINADVDSKKLCRHVPEKSILLATKRRYFSQDCTNLSNSDSSIEKKKRLQKYYSVENNLPPGSDSPLQHHCVRLLSQTESKSETSLYASTGDLILASFQNIPETDSTKLVEDEKSQSLCCSCFRLSKKSGKTKSSIPLFNFSLLLNPLFLVYIFSVMFANCGYPNVFMMLPSYAEVEYNIDKQTAAFLVSIVGLSDLIGRLFMGWFSDLKIIRRHYIFLGSMAISGVLDILLSCVNTKEMLYFFCSSFGFFAGAYIALIAVMLVDVLGVEMLSSAFGWMTVAMSVGLGGGPPLVGALRDLTNSWNMSFIVIGILTVLGAVIVMLEPLIRIWSEKRLKSEKKPVGVEMTQLTAPTELLEK
ncbi:monocarboxylate transporter 12-like [Gigantopelta aegis]|uniref:monocarboxylate transporter 12-like n=1 Tax=Gigantopelta aegis TaxID=1735272 RepID=UPI001B88D999|nr:monocarboxylate transporter 12-like [Gigantopelta aegis]